MAMFVQTTSSLLQSITEHVQQGTLLVEVQHFLDIANEAHRVSKSFTTMSAVSQLRLPQRALVQQLIEKGPDGITEDWTVEGCLSVRELRDLCQGNGVPHESIYLQCKRQLNQHRYRCNQLGHKNNWRKSATNASPKNRSKSSRLYPSSRVIHRFTLSLFGS